MVSCLHLAEVVNVAGSMMLNVLVEHILQDFKFGAAYKACVTSYETLRKHAKDLKGTCDILICDEGHRCVEHPHKPAPGRCLHGSGWLGMLSHESCQMQTKGGGRQQNNRQSAGTGLSPAYPAHRCRSVSF